MQSCGFVLGPEWGPFFGTVFGPPCWAPRCEEAFAEAQQWGRFSGSVFGACVWKASGLRGLKSLDFCNQIYFVTDCWFLCQAPHVTRTRSCGFRHTQLFNACCWRVVEICSAAAAWSLGCYHSRLVCVAKRQVMCRSGTCCAGHKEPGGCCRIVEAGTASASSAVLRAACGCLQS